MPDGKCRATAKVILLVEVSCDGAWGGECPLSQIHRQASESAKNIISRNDHDKIRILKVENIKSILVEKQ